MDPHAPPPCSALAIRGVAAWLAAFLVGASACAPKNSPVDPADPGGTSLRGGA